MSSGGPSQSLGHFGRGNPAVVVAILDGPVDLRHPCFEGATLTAFPSLAPIAAGNGAATAHGTHVASVIFSQPGSSIEGIAPFCTGLIVPVFSDLRSHLACSQLDLARAITIAVEHGAHIINISGGQLIANGEPDGMLAQAIDLCARRNVLVVAAAGNDGCECLHVPASIKTVLAVGAMHDDGSPFASSNWGAEYLKQGLLAPGVQVRGAAPGGGAALRSGTSFAAPFVSGIAALLIAKQIDDGAAPDPHAVRELLLTTASPCRTDHEDCRRVLAGRIDVDAAFRVMTGGETNMTETTLISPSEALSAEERLVESAMDRSQGSPLQRPPIRSAQMTHGESHEVRMSEDASEVRASCGDDASCGCGGKKTGGCSCGGHAEPQKPQLVYALGRIGFDFGSEARRDSYLQAMRVSDASPFHDLALLDYLTADPSEAQGLIWTLNLDATPIYAIQPIGAFAALGYERLREFYRGTLSEGVELVSVPGVIGGSVKLQSGQVVPVIVPAIRGMFAWAVAPLVTLALGARPASEKAQAAYDTQATGLSDFLNRVYYDLRNLGMSPEDRALNYAATNAVQIADVIRSTTQQSLDLDTLRVKRSPICRPDSECYDVEISFFNPDNTNVASRIFRFTVDVSDIIPVSIGPTRSWTRR